MKKTIFALLVCSLLLSSCRKFDEDQIDSSVDDDSSSAVSETIENEISNDDSSEEGDYTDDEIFDFSILTPDELAEYITLGEYKGLESEKYVVEVNQEDIDSYINEVLEAYGEWKEVADRPIKEGDKATIDFAGYLNGVAFDGGTASDQTLEIGSNTYIDGFEDGLIGVKMGEKISLDLTFPEDYDNDELKGQAVVFEVTVKNIQEFVTPELSEDIIKEQTNNEISTIEEYEAYLKEELYSDFTVEKYMDSKNEYWQKAVENATVIKFPDGLVEDYVQSYVDYYTQYATLYGVTLEEFLGTTEEEFRKEIQANAEDTYKNQLVLWAIINEEDFDTNFDTETYSEWLNFFADYLDTSVETLTGQYSEETLKNTCILDKLQDHIYETRTEV